MQGRATQRGLCLRPQTWWCSFPIVRRWRLSMAGCSNQSRAKNPAPPSAAPDLLRDCIRARYASLRYAPTGQSNLVRRFVTKKFRLLR